MPFSPACRSTQSAGWCSWRAACRSRRAQGRSCRRLPSCAVTRCGLWAGLAGCWAGLGWLLLNHVNRPLLPFTVCSPHCFVCALLSPQTVPQPPLANLRHAGVVGAAGLRQRAVPACTAVATGGPSRPPAAAVGSACERCVGLGQGRGTAAGGAAPHHRPPRRLPRRWAACLQRISCIARLLTRVMLGCPIAMRAGCKALRLHHCMSHARHVSCHAALMPSLLLLSLSLLLQRCWSVSCRRRLGL